MADWKNTQAFALALIRESKKHLQNIQTDNDDNNQQKIVGERIIILHLDHANELLMKSFLEKKDYVIDYLDTNGVRKGLKRENEKYERKSLSYVECLELVAKELREAGTPIGDDRKKQIRKFHELRNNVQHRAIDLPLNKLEKIGEFYPHLKGLYEIMFADFDVPFPVIKEFEG